MVQRDKRFHGGSTTGKGKKQNENVLDLSIQIGQ